MLDDYAFTALACLDAYEATSDLSYFKFAQAISDSMIARFFDPTSGGFFDSEPATMPRNWACSPPRANRCRIRRRPREIRWRPSL